MHHDGDDGDDNQGDRLLELFDAAVKLSADEQESYLQEHCGHEPALLDELRALLSVERAGLGSFMREPAAAPVPHGRHDAYDSEGVLTPRRGDSAEWLQTSDASGLTQLVREKRYELNGEISRGGMGVILSGRDCDFDRDVAIKVMRRELSKSPRLVRRFIREAHINGRLQHPGIVPVYEVGLREDQLPFFAMKLIEGRTLSELLAEKPDLISVLPIYEQVCQTVAYAHSRGVVHRDLKPANVMIGEFGEVHVLDWGIAKSSSEEQDGATADVATTFDHVMSSAGTVVGTLPYMAPEQARGELETVGPQADVFALGSMLCELLTGSPARNGTPEEMLVAARDGDISAARTALNACRADDELKALVADCLPSRPADRPASASVVAERIRGYLRSIEERRQRAEIEAAKSLVEAKQARHARRLTAALAIAIGLVLAGGGIAYSWWDRVRRENQDRLATEAERSLREAREALAAAKFEAARWNADRARTLASSKHATAELLQRILDPADAVAKEAGIAIDNNALIARLEQIRIPERGSLDISGYRDSDWAEFDGRYVELLAIHDRRLNEGPADATQQVRAREAPYRLALSFHADRLPHIADVIDSEKRALLRRFIRDNNGDRLLTFVESLDVATTSPKTLHLTAYALQHGGRRDLAIDVLSEGGRAYPKTFSLPMNLARVLMDSGTELAAEAIRHYQAAIALRADDIDARLELAHALHVFIGRNVEVESTVHHILEQPRNDQDLLFRPGYALGHVGRREEALDVLEQAVALRPGDPESWNRIGTIHLDHGRIEPSIEAYTEATRMAPNDAVAHANLGLARSRAGQLPEAQEALLRGLELAPSDGDIHAMLGVVLLGRSQHKEAIEQLQKAVELGTADPRAFTNLGVALSWVSRWDESLAAYRSALRIDPMFTPAFYSLADLYRHTGRLDLAERTLWRCIDSNPGYFGAYNMLSALTWNGSNPNPNWGKVLECFTAGAEANPRHAPFHRYRAHALTKLGRPEPALQALLEARRLGMESQEIHLSIGRTQLALKQGAAAIESFERALAQGADRGSVEPLIERARKLK